jgi:general stress protein CsbA
MEALSIETQITLAIIVPALLVILFTRITFNHWVALILTVALFATSVYAGYTHKLWVYVIDAASLTIGFWYATRMQNSYNSKKEKSHS